MSISENVKTYLSKIAAGNCFGEKVTLVAATKTRTAQEINEAIEAGITDIGENKVQEFRDKFDFVRGGNRHFIGHLQTNKVKYLIGKTYLIHSLDRDELAEELAKRSKDETERHQKILEAAVAEVEKFTSDRAARIEAKRKQNQFVHTRHQSTRHNNKRKLHIHQQ